MLRREFKTILAPPRNTVPNEPHQGIVFLREPAKEQCQKTDICHDFCFSERYPTVPEHFWAKIPSSGFAFLVIMGHLEIAGSALRMSWKRLMHDYVSGKLILKSEKDMERSMAQILEDVIAEFDVALEVKRQQKHRERIVDLEIGNTLKHLLVQTKFYHDKADWKETPAMMNTVESDLKFAKGHADTYVAIIDTIPSTTRAILPFKLKWEKVEIDEQVFNKVYSTINPKTSPARERQQNTLLVNGDQL
jgi:hypothetical protein